MLRLGHTKALPGTVIGTGPVVCARSANGNLNLIARAVKNKCDPGTEPESSSSQSTPQRRLLRRRKRRLHHKGACLTGFDSEAAEKGAVTASPVTASQTQDKRDQVVMFSRRRSQVN